MSFINKRFRPRSRFWQKSLKINFNFDMLLKDSAEIFIFISHLQRLLSTFERISIFFSGEMNVISARDDIFFQARYKLWSSIPSTDL